MLQEILFFPASACFIIEINLPFANIRVIWHCHDQIPLLIPEMNMAAGLAIDPKAKILQSLNRFLSRDYRQLGQIARSLCQEMRASAPWVPAPVEPNNVLQGPFSN